MAAAPAALPVPQQPQSAIRHFIYEKKRIGMAYRTNQQASPEQMRDYQERLDALLGQNMIAVKTTAHVDAVMGIMAIEQWQGVLIIGVVTQAKRDELIDYMLQVHGYAYHHPAPAAVAAAGGNNGGGGGGGGGNGAAGRGRGRGGRRGGGRRGGGAAGGGRGAAGGGRGAAGGGGEVAGGGGRGAGAGRGGGEVAAAGGGGGGAGGGEGAAAGGEAEA